MRTLLQYDRYDEAGSAQAVPRSLRVPEGLLNHLIGVRDERRRDREALSSSGLEGDNQIVPGGLIERHIPVAAFALCLR
jgi:hypothetical protein